MDNDRHCALCGRIGNGDYDTDKDDVVSFEPLNPVTRGHRLFVPVEHVVDASTKPWVTASTMRVASEYARARNIDCNLITSIGAAATQSIKHLHIHYVPRSVGDGLPLPWTPQQKEESH